MKKILLFFCAVALIASCSKDIDSIDDTVVDNETKADVDTRVNASLTLKNCSGEYLWIACSLDQAPVRFGGPGVMIMEPETLANPPQNLSGALLSYDYASETFVIYNNAGYAFRGSTVTFVRFPISSVWEVDALASYYIIKVLVNGEPAYINGHTEYIVNDTVLHDTNIDAYFSAPATRAGTMNIELIVEAYK
ncbi:MAG: hypothetical protein LIO79_01820 [Rikenellaceae bacterium]|nr:hypothetical protein [Rikenellaceae bacterium]